MYPRHYSKPAGIDAELHIIAGQWLNLQPLQKNDGTVCQMIWKIDRVVALIADSDKDRSSYRVIFCIGMQRDRASPDCARGVIRGRE